MTVELVARVLARYIASILLVRAQGEVLLAHLAFQLRALWLDLFPVLVNPYFVAIPIENQIMPLTTLKLLIRVLLVPVYIATVVIVVIVLYLFEHHLEREYLCLF